MTNKYIEFRVYLKDNYAEIWGCPGRELEMERDKGVILELANQMQDKLCDFVSECNDCVTPMFDEDVTFEIVDKRSEEKKES